MDLLALVLWNPHASVPAAAPAWPVLVQARVARRGLRWWRRPVYSSVVAGRRRRGDGAQGCRVGCAGGGGSGRKVVAQGGAAYVGVGVEESTGADSYRSVGAGGAASRTSREGSCRAVWGLGRVARRRSRENRGMATGNEGRFLASSVVVRTYRVPG